MPLKQRNGIISVFSPSVQRNENILLHLTKYTQYTLKIVQTHNIIFSCPFFFSDILPQGTWFQVNALQKNISSDTSAAALHDERLQAVIIAASS